VYLSGSQEDKAMMVLGAFQRVDREIKFRAGDESFWVTPSLHIDNGDNQLVVYIHFKDRTSLPTAVTCSVFSFRLRR
jgi:hypothetical protein